MRVLKSHNVKPPKNYFYINLQNYLLAENVFVPLFNEIHKRESYSLEEFSDIVSKIAPLKIIGISGVDYFGEVAGMGQRYSGTDTFEMKKVDPFDPLWHQQLVNHVRTHNEMAADETDQYIKFISPSFIFDVQVLEDYHEKLRCGSIENAMEINGAKIPHDLSIRLNQADITARLEILRLIEPSLLYVLRPYIDYNFDVFEETYLASRNACGNPEIPQTNNFADYIRNTVRNYLDQSALESGLS